MTRRPAMPTTQLSDGEWVQSGLFTHHECCDAEAGADYLTFLRRRQ